jgi:hypothetical protein
MSVSVQDLMNMVAPREGQVDPSTCLECASLRKKVRQAGKRRNAAEFREATGAMRIHKDYGHPDDPRRLVEDLPLSAPRVE